MPASIRVLLVGSGGREHALAWKLAQSPMVERVYAVPGNGGTASHAKIENVAGLSQDDFAGLAAFAAEANVNLLLPGPEAPLVAGIVDYFAHHAAAMPCFGPTKAAARMEGSKAFAKDFMRRHSVPTAAYQNFSSYEQAKHHLDTLPADHAVVIKASGLAAGKGVIIPATKDDAHQALREIMLDKAFGGAGDEVVIEEFLQGEEISILSLCDGTVIRSLPPAQDHKRIFDGDQGPNTGGMGTYAPTPIVSKAMLDRIDAEILRPTIDGMKQDGFPFVGCLFTGIMITSSGPKVLEYNVRFGDPETQSVLCLLESDLAEAVLACSKGDLDQVVLRISSQHAATVVVAAAGYPGSYKKGVEMKIDTLPKGVTLFHAGTALVGDTLRTAGGRVIASTATGKSLRDAVNMAYQGVSAVHFEGMQYRKDIGHRALR